MPTQNDEDPILYQTGKPVYHKTRDRSWVNTVNYWTLHANQRSLPINDYSDSQILRTQKLGHETVLASNGSLVSDQYVGFNTVADLDKRHNDISSWVAETEIPDAMLENEAAVKALNKLANAKVNLPVSVAEAGKTADLILGKARTVISAYRAFRRGQFGKVRRIFEESTLQTAKRGARKLSTNWLEYQYGWRPLLMDIHGAAEAIVDRIYGGEIPWIVVTATASSHNARVSRGVGGYSPGSYTLTSGVSDKKYKIKIEAEISNPYLRSAQQLGLTNPGLVAWELVPFSFVFDWFVSVGDYLTAATALQGVTVRRAFSSRLRTVACQYYSHAQSFTSSDKRWHSGYDLTMDSNGRGYSRKPYVVNPFYLYPPVNRDPLNFRRLANGLALLVGNARGMRV